MDFDNQDVISIDDVDDLFGEEQTVEDEPTPQTEPAKDDGFGADEPENSTPNTETSNSNNLEGSLDNTNEPYAFNLQQTGYLNSSDHDGQTAFHGQASHQKLDELTDRSLYDQINHLEDNLMAFVIQDFENVRLRYNRLQPDFFRNENYVLYKMFSNITSEKFITVDETYVKIYLKAHTMDFALDTDKIELKTFETDGVSAVDGLVLAVLEQFRRLSNLNWVSNTSFDDVLVRFKTVYASLALEDTLQQTTTALHMGIRYNRASYRGVEGAVEYLGKRINSLNALTSDEYAYSMEKASDDDYDLLNANDYELIGNLHSMPTLDEAMHGIRTNTLVTMVAPEKGMKSKLATRVTHSVMLNGHNVCFWGKEGGSTKVKAELRAIHFDHYYNVERGKNYAPISSSDIMLGLLSESVKELERISWNDLFKSGKYGELITPNFPFEYEELENVVRSAGEESNCKLVVIDYVQVIESKTFTDTRVVIEKAYKRLESLKGILKICIWCPAQMSTEAIKAFSLGQHKELRNITSHSNEPTKSSDFNFLLYVNDEMSSKNVAKVYSLPSRISGDFEPFNVYTDKESNKVTEIRGQEIVFDEDGEMQILEKD